MENHQKEKITYLESQLDRISELITRADTKASILLALLGVVIAAGISKEHLDVLSAIIQLLRNNYSPWIYFLLSLVIALPYLSLLAGFVFLVFSLFARIGKTSAGVPASGLFFRKIAEYKTFSAFAESFSEILENLDSELMTEIFINSSICSKKYRFFNIGLILVTVGSILMVILQVAIVMKIS